MRSRQVVPLLLTAALLAGCSAPAEPRPDDLVGTSELAPDRGTDSAKAAKAGGKPVRTKTKQPKPRKHPVKRTRPAHPKPKAGGATEVRRSEAARQEPDAAPSAASLTDAVGDVRGALTGAPAHADLTGVRLTRDDAFEVAVSFAGAVPERQGDDRIVQVAAFFDLDGDGETDYEVWASLADNGWGTSYRSRDAARFGDESGVRVQPRGRTLLLAFPLSHLEGARRLSWAVGAEWGTLEQVAAGTTAKDNAPDAGWARLPG